MYKHFKQPMDGRTVEVTVDNDNNLIDFNFVNDDGRKQWFYDIRIDEWVNNDRNWHSHMRRKSWFTDEMENFINSNTKDLCKTETD